MTVTVWACGSPWHLEVSLGGEEPMMVANSLDLVCAPAKTEPCSIRLSCCAWDLRGPHPLCKCRSAQDKKNHEYYRFHLKLFITKPFNGWDIRGHKHTLEVKLPCGKEEGELEIKTLKRSRRVDVSHDFLTHLMTFYQLCQRPCLPRQHEQVTSALERRLPSLLLNRMDVNDVNRCLLGEWICGSLVNKLGIFNPVLNGVVQDWYILYTDTSCAVTPVSKL